MLLNSSYNPDVLSCLANLSSDEVFTPPSLANEILDLLPDELWSNKDAKFLDPVCKSGVFLREIAKRLLKGLEKEIPDLQKRIDHIFHNQIYGIAITELTGLLARRSVYCSKKADGEYSITEFDNEQGNIVFEKTDHKWKGERCEYCGASKGEYKRGEDLETHAYKFIHNDKPEDFFAMKFDVIIGNPPYQLSDGGNQASAIPLYHKFIEQAKKMNPRFLSMIVPSRWFSGGRGLDEFRDAMLRDKRLTKLIDYFDSTECFPGVDISGGICYFLWEKDKEAECEITTVRQGERSIMTRPLLENGLGTFIRFNEATGILRKVIGRKEKSFGNLVSSLKPFGFRTYFEGSKRHFDGAVSIHTSKGVSYVAKADIETNVDVVDRFKVFVPRAYGERGAFPYIVLGKSFLGERNTCSTETYLFVGPFESREICENVMSYYRTRFFRFLVLLKKNTQDAPKRVYELVPTQSFDEPWTDEKLYSKYGITTDEQSFIESMVRPMEVDLF